MLSGKLCGYGEPCLQAAFSCARCSSPPSGRLRIGSTTPCLPELPRPHAPGAFLEKRRGSASPHKQTLLAVLGTWLRDMRRSGGELAALPVPRRPCSSQAGVEARDLTRRQPGGGRCQLQGHMGLRRPHPHPQNQGTQDNCSASPGPVSSSLMWGDRHPMSASLT